MTPPDKASGFGKDSLSSTLGTVAGGVLLIIIGGLWAGKISGPENPEFWLQIAPFVIAGLLLALPWTRHRIVQAWKWLLDLRILTRKQQDALAAKSQSQRQAIRTSGVPGLTKHGRLSALQNIHTGLVTVKWTSNRSVVGTLHPGRAGGWEVVYHETGESLGWVDSKESGMERLQARAVEEH